MPNLQDMPFLNNKPNEGAPHFIIYNEVGGARLHFVCQFIFEQVLKCQCSVTNDYKAFQASEAFKINYSKERNNSVFSIGQEGLLSEVGLRNQKPELILQENGAIMFPFTHKTSNLDFDIFSAVFYFVSRYEEWQDYTPDAHGRFEANASLAFKHQLHQNPLVDEWILHFRKKLVAYYPGLQIPPIKFSFISTIDLDNLYAFKAKGLLRSAGALLRDALKFNFKLVAQRLSVLTGTKKDPFDIYEEVSEFCSQNNIPLIYFFLYRTGTKYDRTVNPESPAFSEVFQILKSKKAHFGLHPSYDSAYESGILERELKAINTASQTTINASRQHFLRYNIRQTPAQLTALGIQYDFTMGYASSPGFRAGTAYPFYHYDFTSEEITNLLHIPFCVMDGAYLIYDKQNTDVAYQSMLLLAEKVKKTGGYFVSIFHESTISDHLYGGFGTLYKKLHLALKELSQKEN